ncbi:MAG TPA: YbjN domain-containing protein [Candidatus Limnocylindrales bacterium]|nr:YbjN domain-containing protein [Candidatus Limnocylindrales bacterium]
MPSPEPGASTGAPSPADVERWLTDLDLRAVDRGERAGVASWDLVLDGRRRFDLRITVILEPSLALICWAQLAPPINDMFRKSYRKLLRWNDEFPFVKFSVSEDERPVLAVELPIAQVRAGEGLDALGLALARIVGIADRLLEDTAPWLWIGGRMPDQSDRVARNLPFLERFDGRLVELASGADESTTSNDAPSTPTDAEATA